MDNSFSQLVSSSQQIQILLPQNPTFDVVSAGLGLYMSIYGNGGSNHQVAIYSHSPMMVGFNRIIGINKISSELGNKNLTIKFAGYDANNIEKVSYDIINGEFNLTVVPKVGFASPTKEQMDISFTGISADLVILVGGSNSSDFPLLSSGELGSAKIAHIGVRSLTSDAGVLSFAKPGASVSEVVASLIKENSINIDPDIATNLVMGIEDGSSNFAGNEVTPDTFETFAWLLRNGGQRQSRIKLSPANFPVGAIPTQPFNKPAQQNPEPVLENVENKEETVLENPPSDWLQPKVFKSDSFSENKG